MIGEKFITEKHNAPTVTSLKGTLTRQYQIIKVSDDMVECELLYTNDSMYYSGGYIESFKLDDLKEYSNSNGRLYFIKT